MSNPFPSFVRNTFHHFQTFVWLRWKIRTNQLRHGSKLGRALASIMLVLLVLTTLMFFGSGFGVGAIAPRFFARDYYFLIWDAVVALTVFVWVIHVASDLQRSDAITFDRILHLPVSFAEVFAVNYLSSLVNVHFLCLSSFCLGLVLGSVFSIGLVSLLILPPLAAFFFVLTALTYQLQGWLASIMSNPRRRQWVMIAVPFVIILLTQTPTFLATQFSRRMEHESKSIQAAPTPTPTAVAPSEVPALPSLEPADANAPSERSGPAGEAPQGNVEEETGTEKNVGAIATTPPYPAPSENEKEKIEEGDNAQGENGSSETAKQQSRIGREKAFAVFVGMMKIANWAFPPLWLAGAVDSMVGGTLWGIVVTLAMFGIGTLSVRRNFRQTLRYYKGEIDARVGTRTRTAVGRRTEGSSDAKVPQVRMVEWRLPWVSDMTSAIVVMTWRSMMRAPEVKLYLLLPFIAPIVMFGALGALKMPNVDELKAGCVVCVSAFTLFLTVGFLGNQFGFDRSGFRAFVLSPVPRERILLGRNIAAVSILLLQTTCFAFASSCFFGLGFEKSLCGILLSASMLPTYCLMINLMSIYAPFPIAADSMQPKHFDLVPVLLSLVLSMLMPAITVFAILPLAIEWGFESIFNTWRSIPIALILSVFWLGCSLLIYRWALPYQGRILARRELELLRIVTSKIE